MKKTLAVILAILMMISLAACGNGKASPSAAPTSQSKDAMTGQLRVTVQSWMLSKYDFEAMKKDFESKHPGVTVVINKVDNADTTTNMLQWSQGKTDCDIAIGGSREQAVQYAAKDYIVKFENDFFTGDFAKDKFFAPFLELGNVDGTQYMIPFTGEVMFIVANKKLMQNAGLVGADGKIAAPKTWDELYNYAKAATVKSGNQVVSTGLTIDWGTNFMTYSYLSSLQGIKGSIFESDKKTIDFTSSESAGLLNMWKKLYADGYATIDTFADMDAGRTNFKAGKVAMLMTAASRWIECQANLGADSTTVIPVPGTDKNGSLAYIHGAVIPKMSPKIDLAKVFIKEELLSTTNQKKAMDATGKMSPLLAQYADLKNADWPTVINATKSGITTPLYKDFAKLDSGINVEMQKCITGKQSVADTQKNLSTLIKGLDLTTGLKSK